MTMHETMQGIEPWIFGSVDQCSTTELAPLLLNYNDKHFIHEHLLKLSGEMSIISGKYMQLGHFLILIHDTGDPDLAPLLGKVHVS